MHQRWLSLPLLTASVSAFYPYQGGSDIGNNKRSFSIEKSESLQDNSEVVKLDIKRVTRKRQDGNAFNVVESQEPSQSHSLAIDQDGSDYSYMATASISIVCHCLLFYAY